MGASTVVVGTDSTGAAKTGGSRFVSTAGAGRAGAGFSSAGVEGPDLLDFPSLFFLMVNTLLTESKIFDFGRSLDFDDDASGADILKAVMTYYIDESCTKEC